jgi:hypothetical protein
MAERLEPQHKPDSDIREEQPKSAVVPTLWYTLGPWVLLACVLLLALALWMRGGLPIRSQNPDIPQNETIGTAGDRTPGGGDPGREPDSTNDEIRQKTR